MPLELRCNGTLHGILQDDHKTLEVKCKRRTCGAQPGVVILHTISLETGEVIRTMRYSEPQNKKGK